MKVEFARMKEKLDSKKQVRFIDAYDFNKQKNRLICKVLNWTYIPLRLFYVSFYYYLTPYLIMFAHVAFKP